MNNDSMSSTNYNMSKSCFSSRNNSNTSSNNNEESGWTSYLEGFMANDDDISDYSYESSCISSPMASHLDDDDDDPNLRDRRDYLITRKRRSKATRKIDLELEDTASSPSYYSPKVNDIDQLLFMNAKGLDGKDVSQEKGNTMEQAGKGIIEMGFMDTQLRRKGLCLVPMSMLINKIF